MYWNRKINEMVTLFWKNTSWISSFSSATGLPSKTCREVFMEKCQKKKKNIKQIAFGSVSQNYAISSAGLKEKSALKYLPTYINCINDIGEKRNDSRRIWSKIFCVFRTPLVYILSLRDESRYTERSRSVTDRTRTKVFLFASGAQRGNYGDIRVWSRYKILDFFWETHAKIRNTVVILKSFILKTTFNWIFIIKW